MSSSYKRPNAFERAWKLDLAKRVDDASAKRDHRSRGQGLSGEGIPPTDLPHPLLTLLTRLLLLLLLILAIASVVHGQEVKEPSINSLPH